LKAIFNPLFTRTKNLLANRRVTALNDSAGCIDAATCNAFRALLL
jgi:hypothetical protein